MKDKTFKGGEKKIIIFCKFFKLYLFATNLDQADIDPTFYCIFYVQKSLKFSEKITNNDEKKL